MAETKNVERKLKHYIIFGVVWGVFMFLFMEIFLKLGKEDAMTTKSLMIGLVWWIGIAGVLYGVICYYVVTYWNKRKEKKKSLEAPSA